MLIGWIYNPKHTSPRTFYQRSHTDLVPPAQCLCRTLRHTDVVKLALILELRERRDRLFHGHFGV
jgi:hypothetical protein